MSDLKKYHGVIPAFYACYDEEGNISPERVRGLTRHLIGRTARGLGHRDVRRRVKAGSERRSGA